MKTLRFAGHPLHAAMVHLPLGAWMAAALWDLLGLYRDELIWWQLAYYSIALGLVAAIPASILGLIDYLAIPKGHRAETVGLYHLSAVLSAAVLYLASLLVRASSDPAGAQAGIIAVALSGLALLFLMVGGWLGAELVYRHRVGIDEQPTVLPETESKPSRR